MMQLNKKWYIWGGLTLLSAVSLYYLYSKSKPTPPAETNIPTTSGVNNQLIKQSIDDLNFGTQFKKNKSQLPFLEKLPIFTDRYNLIFDFEKNQIRAYLFKGVKSTEVNSEIYEKLKEIGVDTKKYPVYFKP